jgi:phosphatidylglycerol:prolipoprotein diacylglycerol transferase
MHPILFRVFGWPVYSYGVLLALAYLAGLQLAVVRARRAGLDATKITDLGIYLIIAALVGAKLMLIVVDFEHFRARPAELMSLVRVGGVFYGGLIAAFLVGVWLIRRYQLPLWTTADLIAPGIALGHVVGRFGCLLAGCCFGIATNVPWAITFTDPVAENTSGTPLDTPLHPTQLYDAGAELVILAILLATERRGRPFPGRTFWLYMLLYAISRYVIEFYRGDDRGMILGMSTSQFLALVIVPVGVAMLWRLRNRDANTLTPQTAP